jgi:hypothetical protein
VGGLSGEKEAENETLPKFQLFWALTRKVAASSRFGDWAIFAKLANGQVPGQQGHIQLCLGSVCLQSSVPLSIDDKFQVWIERTIVMTVRNFSSVDVPHPEWAPTPVGIIVNIHQYYNRARISTTQAI